MWCSIQEFKILDLRSNTVLLLYSDEANTLKILVQQPWFFHKYLIGLYKPMKDESMDTANFDYATFWIQLHNLPSTHMNKTNVEAIGWTLGTVK